MCIIAIKRKGIEMPDETAIKNMFNNNHDGAGFMYTKDGKVHIEKGFMDYTALRTRLDRLEREINTKKEAVVLHFRIGTAGGNIPANTHPFPISDAISELQALKTTVNLGVAHNGIISITPRQKDISDTMEYIASQLAPLYRACPQFYKNEDLMTLVGNAISSKMAFLTGSGQVYTIGPFITDEKSGILYSNTSYSYASKYRSVYSYGWDNYDDDYDYGTSGWWARNYKKQKASDYTPLIAPSSGYTYTSDSLMPLPEGAWMCDVDMGTEYDCDSFGRFYMDFKEDLYIYDEESMSCRPLIEDFDVYDANNKVVRYAYSKAEPITVLPNDCLSIYEITGPVEDTDDETGGDTFLPGDMKQ